jgi:hypothetical protein
MLLGNAAVKGASHEHMPWLAARAVYLENISEPGAWWANPALPALITKNTIWFSAVAPLGERYLLSSARLVLPFREGLSFGAGVLGAGDYVPGSSRASMTGEFSFRSSFAFSRPRFQANMAWDSGRFGMAGILLSLGSDGEDMGQGRIQTRLSPAFAAGWLSSRQLPLQASATLSTVHHTLDTSFVERTLRLGVRLETSDSRVRGALEKAIALQEDIGYDVLRMHLSAKLFGPVAAFAGYSSDVRAADAFANGRSLHLGAEVFPDDQSPFFGGYGVRFHGGSHWNVSHRIWLAYSPRPTPREALHPL